MKKRIFIPLFLSICLCLITCSKKEETPTPPLNNQLPFCHITTPTNGQEIARGDTVIITVDATDNDGSITEVRFFVDGVGKSAASSSPYNYKWATNNENIGPHNLKATTIDNDGASTSDEISVIIIDGGFGSIIDLRDGQVYKTIEIGSQTWFAENLNYNSSGSSWYNADSANGEIYGRLYNWDASLSACPSGWHLPSDDEWKVLEIYLGMSQSEADTIGWRGTDEGLKLKNTSGWNSNGNGNNSSGFTALPGGVLIAAISEYSFIGEYGVWWSATEYTDPYYVWYRSLDYRFYTVNRSYADKSPRFSIRCLKN